MHTIPYGTTFANGDTTIEYNGNTYTKAAHQTTTARFYVSDGGGVEKTDSDGFTYREPQTDNPVYVTRTAQDDYYNPASKNSTVGDILESDWGWLASTRISPISEAVMYCVDGAGDVYAGAFCFCVSVVHENRRSGALRPLVSLGSKVKIDTTDSSRDGSTAEKAWKLVKK